MDYISLSKHEKYNTLSSEFVFDNANGESSEVQNKTSIWIIGPKIARIANISMSNIDGIDEFGLQESVLAQAIDAVCSDRSYIVMRCSLLEHLSHHGLFTNSDGKLCFAGIPCGIGSIPKNEKIVI